MLHFLTYHINRLIPLLSTVMTLFLCYMMFKDFTIKNCIPKNFKGDVAKNYSIKTPVILTFFYKRY